MSVCRGVSSSLTSSRCEQIGSDKREPVRVPVMSSAFQSRWVSTVRDIGRPVQIINMSWYITAESLLKACSASRDMAVFQMQGCHATSVARHTSLPGRT